MAPPQRTQVKKAKPAATLRGRPARGEVKVSVMNICGPFPSDNPQTPTPAKISRPVLRTPASSVMAQVVSKPVSFGMASKEPQTPTTTIGSYLSRDSVSRGTRLSKQHQKGHSPGTCPLYLGGVASSTLRECLIIRSLHGHIRKKAPERRAAR